MPPPRAILGLDAAWTATRPSGVALLVEDRGGWRTAALAPSYADFAGLAQGRPVDWARRPPGAPPPPAAALLRAVRALATGARLTVVAVDMPLARAPITGRRRADDAVSSVFGARHCGTHSPSAERPGPIADRLRRGFEREGFPLRTLTPGDAAAARRGRPSLVEVYPHTALLALLSRGDRVRYKAARAGAYWPALSPLARRRRLLAAWHEILGALGRDVAAVDLPLPGPEVPLARLKRHEDALDALVCAWVGIQLLRGRARPLGDAGAAIWTP